jgi:predicted transcriptional regulator
MSEKKLKTYYLNDDIIEKIEQLFDETHMPRNWIVMIAISELYEKRKGEKKDA